MKKNLICLLVFGTLIQMQAKESFLTWSKIAEHDTITKQDSTAIKLKEVELKSRDFLKTITKIDLKKIPVNTAQDLLRKVPGLFIAQHAGGGKAEQIFLRGFDSDHGTDVAVYADGMPVNIVSHAHGQGYSDLHFVIPETIENIDFGKGSYYADRGDFNTAGYVDFRTRDNVDNSLLKFEFGNFNTARLYTQLNVLNDKQNKRYAYAAAEYNYTDGPFDVKQNFNRLNAFFKYNEWLTDKSYLNLQLSSFSSSWNASGQIPTRAIEKGIVGRYGSIDPTEGGQTGRTNALLKYKYILDSGDLLESSLWYSKYNFKLYSNFTFFLNDKNKGDEIEQIDDRNIFGGDNKYTKKIEFENSRGTWTSGLGFRYDDINTLQLNHVYRRDELLNRLSNVTGTETNLHGYSGFTWEVGKWTLNTAVRVDNFIFNLHDFEDKTLPIGKSVQKTQISPKFNISYEQNPNTLWFFKFGKGFHSNDIRVVINRKGKEILPYSIGSDLGVRLRLAKNLIVTPALWFNYLQQEFVYVGDEAVVEPSGKTRRLGVDLGVRYQPLDHLYINANVNYAHARSIEDPKGEDYIPLAPIWVSTGGIGWDFSKNFSANIQYRFMGERPAIEDNSLSTKPYMVNDLLLSYNKENWGVNLQIQNLFNVKWNEAQFATETQLQGESASITDIAYTPGTPFFVKAGVYYKFL